MSEHSWPSEFEQRNRRRLRVLFVGNIGNNAYLNATFLRRAGIDVDVLCHDYYDVLGTPEWEHGPRSRPRWFVQGPLHVCVRYLDARHEERHLDEFLLWLRLRIAQSFPASGREVAAWRLRALALHGRLVHIRYALRHRRSAYWSRLHLVLLMVRGGIRRLSRRPRRPAQRPVSASPSAVAPDPVRGWYTTVVASAIELFRERFPDRLDALTERDFVGYTPEYLDLWRRLFAQYDVVQCYSTDPIKAYLSGKRPYVGFEHGTLRAFTLNDDPVSRLTALAYRESDHTFITNGDCLPYARQIGIPRYTPMIHPLDVEQHRRRDEAAIDARRRTIGTSIILFCPMRHDWVIKGTDVHLRALPYFRQQLGGDFTLVLCEWGEDTEASRKLVSDLGLSSHVAWLPRLRRPEFITMLQAADVVLDQMTLPHFDATVPQALAAGTPVIMSYEPDSTTWLIPEPAPILSAFDEPGVAAAVSEALDESWREDFRARARRWIDSYHHPRTIVDEHLRIYRELLEEHS